MTDVSLQIALAGFFSFVQERLKLSPAIGALTPYTQVANKAFSLLLAVLTTIGLTTVWVVDPTTQLGSFTIGNIPTTFEGLSRMAITVFEQYWFQKAWFKGIVRDETQSARYVQVAR